MSPLFLRADLVAITLEFQKNNKRNKTVHMFSTDDELLCPVRSWAIAVKRLWNAIPQANEDTKVCTYIDQGSIREIDSTYARSRIRYIVDLLGVTKLGFIREDDGLHSIHSGGAMAIFLSVVATIIIQQVGHWESDAFMEYIREQVETVTVGVSRKMRAHQDYYHLNRLEEEKNWLQNVPTLEGEGKPLEIPHSAYFSKQVLGMDQACSL